MKPMQLLGPSSVTQPRDFEAKVVTSALAVHNVWLSAPDNWKAVIPQAADDAFRWLPGVLAHDANAIGLSTGGYTWERSTPAQVGAATTALLVIFQLGAARGSIKSKKIMFGGGMKDGTYVPDRELTLEQWLVTTLDDLRVTSRFVYRDGEVLLASVPLLCNIVDCAAYVAAIYLRDKWGIRKRIRQCPFFSVDVRQHYFLDYRPRDDGTLVRGNAMKFCCDAHRNAQNQKLYRERRRVSTTPQARRHK